MAVDLHRRFLAGELKGPESHEVNPGLGRGTRDNYLYFTLSCCLNFQRNSPRLWQSALATFQDPETRYLFFPEQVHGVSEERVAADLFRHRLAIQRTKHPRIWRAISRTLHEHYDSDPRMVLAEGGLEVGRTLDILQVTKKQLFPYLGGPKLSNYWLFILTSFTDVRLRDPERISIIPDVHVIRSSVRIGLVEEGATPLEVERAWTSVLAATGIPPGEMHSALWRWSRARFESADTIKRSDWSPPTTLPGLDLPPSA